MNDTPCLLDTPKTQFKVRLQQQPGGNCSGQGQGTPPIVPGVQDYRLTTLVLERRLAKVLYNMETCQGGPRLTLHSPGVSVVTPLVSSSSDEMNEGSGISRRRAPE